MCVCVSDTARDSVKNCLLLNITGRESVNFLKLQKKVVWCTFGSVWKTFFLSFLTNSIHKCEARENQFRPGTCMVWVWLYFLGAHVNELNQTHLTAPLCDLEIRHLTFLAAACGCSGIIMTFSVKNESEISFIMKRNLTFPECWTWTMQLWSYFSHLLQHESHITDYSRRYSPSCHPQPNYSDS